MRIVNAPDSDMGLKIDTTATYSLDPILLGPVLRRTPGRRHAAYFLLQLSIQQCSSSHTNTSVCISRGRHLYSYFLSRSVLCMLRVGASCTWPCPCSQGRACGYLRISTWLQHLPPRPIENVPGTTQGPCLRVGLLRIIAPTKREMIRTRLQARHDVTEPRYF